MKKRISCLLSIFLSMVIILDMLPPGLQLKTELIADPLQAFALSPGDDTEITRDDFSIIITVGEIEYNDDDDMIRIELYAAGDCPSCGYTFEEDFWEDGTRGDSVDDIQHDVDSLFDQMDAGCGHHCVECAHEEHCHFCGGCLDDDVMPCGECYSKRCLSCHDDDCYCEVCEKCVCDDDGEPQLEECHMAGGESIMACADCADDSLLCEHCDQYIFVGDYCPDTFYCETCALCSQCLEDEDVLKEFGHCKQCTICGSDEYVCDDCFLCLDEAESYTHCPLCEQCFGEDNEVEWCAEGGNHCIDCCLDNGWMCPACGQCVEGLGEELCEECGFCPECCLSESEDAGCIHGYCVMSSDFEEHACPDCGRCTQDEECEYCGLCPECQSDYHCEHEICPDDTDEWEAHVCEGCGDCFEPDELCEWCGMCESCNDHCEHDICPEDSDYEDHICTDCDNCFEEEEFCHICHKCLECCAENTRQKNCKHGICVESEEFQTHYCFADHQCLEYCDHDAAGECSHEHVSDQWESDDSSHWHICADCGSALNCMTHTIGDPVVVKEPNAATRTPGVGNLVCTVCGRIVDTVKIPYVEVTEEDMPYIILQPSGVSTRPTDLDLHKKPQYATFTVYAGGGDLHYQWYCKEHTDYGEGYALTDERGLEEAYALSGKDAVSGATSTKLTVLVDPYACNKSYTYWCVVSNSLGSVETIHVPLRTEHAYYRYEDNHDGKTHRQQCAGWLCQRTRDEKHEKLPHRFGAWEVKTPATETAEGVMVRACIDCNAKETQSIPKVEPGHTHVFDQWVTNDEYHWLRCKCGVAHTVRLTVNGVTKSVVDKQKHAFGSPVTVKEPTDKRCGVTEETCTSCGYVRSTEIPKLPHSHDFTTLRKKSVGRYSLPNGYIDHDYHVIYCDGCTQTIREPHTYSYFTVWNFIDFDSKGNLIPGRLRHACTKCGHVEYVDYKGGWPIITDFYLDGFADYGANKGGIVEGPASAMAGERVTLKVKTLDGYVLKKINNTAGSTYCGFDFGEVTDQDYLHMDRDYDVKWANSKLDWTKFSYNSDEQSITFTMPDGPLAIMIWTETCTHKNAHLYRDIVEPTCTGYGSQVWRCDLCHAVRNEYDRIDPIGHDFQYDPAADYDWGDCTHYASHGVKCTRCGTTMRRNEEIGHDWEEIGNESPPLCFTNGHESDEVCRHCGATRPGKTLKMVGHHDWDEIEEIRAATPTQKGVFEHTCALCGKKETYLTDYSGPDYRLTVDKAKVYFDFVYGTEPEPVIVTFQSVGRDPVTKLTKVDFTQVGGLYEAEIVGDMQVQIKPIMHSIVYEDYNEDILEIIATAESGEEMPVAPDIHVSANIKRTQQKYTLTVEGGTAKEFNDPNEKHRAGTIQLQAGAMFRLEPDREEGFVGFKLIEDESGLVAKQMDPKQPKYTDYFMPQNDVVIRAVYEDHIVSGLKSSQLIDENYCELKRYLNGETYYLMPTCANVPEGKYVSGYHSEQVKLQPSDKIVTLASFVMPDEDVVIEEIYAPQIPLTIYLGDGSCKVPKDIITALYQCATEYPDNSLKFDGNSLDKIDLDGDGVFDVHLKQVDGDLVFEKLETASKCKPVKLNLDGLKYAPLIWDLDGSKPKKTTTTVATTTQPKTTTVATTTQPKTTTVATTTQPKTTTVATTTQPKTTTVATTTQPKTTTAATTTQPKTTTVATTTQPKTTTAATTTQPIATTVATTTQPKTTTVATTTQPKATTAATTTQPKTTTVAITTQPKVTTAATTPQPKTTTVATTTQPKTTTAATTTQPIATTVATTTQPKATTVATTTQPIATTVATTTQPKATTAATTTQPKTTTAATTTQPKTTTVATTTQPKATTVATTTQPKATTVATTTQPKVTTVATTTQPKVTTVATTTQPKATTAATTTQPKATTTESEATTLPNTTTTEASATEVTTEAATEPALTLEVTELSLAPGGQYKIEANQTGLSFSSSDPKVAIVSPDGTITALTNGTTIITVFDEAFHAVQLKLTVEDAPEAYLLGDVNEDSIVNASDAAKILIAAAQIGAGNPSGLTAKQELAANVNSDDRINASDAAVVLIYAAAVGAGHTDAKITDYVK